MLIATIALVILSSYIYTFVQNDNDINKMNAFGYIFNYVQSGSMAPEINTYDVVISKRATFDEIEVGDIITYECNYAIGVNGDIQPSPKTMIVIHRVIEKGDGYLRTKGDANEVEDPWQVMPDQVVSKYVKNLRQLKDWKNIFNK